MTANAAAVDGLVTTMLRRREKIRAEELRLNSYLESLGHGEVGVELPPAVSLPDFSKESGAMRWIVEGLVSDDSISMVSADGGVGKTMFLVHMTMSIANGRPFLGRAVDKRTSLYVMAEGSRHGFRERVLDCATNTGMRPLSPDWWIQPANFSSYELLNSNVERWIDQTGAKIAVLDTLGFFHDGSENSADDWKSKVQKPLMGIKARTGCSFIIAHHTTQRDKEGKLRQKGSSQMRDDCDHFWLMDYAWGFDQSLAQSSNLDERMQDSRRLLFISKSKYGSDGLFIPLHFDKTRALFMLDESR